MRPGFRYFLHDVIVRLAAVLLEKYQNLSINPNANELKFYGFFFLAAKRVEFKVGATVCVGRYMCLLF